MLALVDTRGERDRSFDCLDYIGQANRGGRAREFEATANPARTAQQASRSQQADDLLHRRHRQSGLVGELRRRNAHHPAMARGGAHHRFEKPAPAELISAAQKIQLSIDPALAWEFSPEEEFGFADLAQEYFATDGKGASQQQQAATLFRLFESPHYFRRAGKGRFRKADAQTIQLALAAIEKKKQVALQIAAWVAELGAGRCPDAIREQLYKILFKPDKNAPEYKAVVEASRATHLPPLALLQQAGAIASAYQFHWKRFLFENFPKGTGFPAVEAPAIRDELPLAAAQAFSIDDSATTEIDDALSVQGLGTGTVTVGIHIAAPGLAVQPGDAVDKLGRARLSTVYMPGYKVTMLPDDVVQAYTLIGAQALTDLLRAEADNPNRSLYDNNKAVYSLLRYGVPVKTDMDAVQVGTDDPASLKAYLRAIDRFLRMRLRYDTVSSLARAGSTRNSQAFCMGLRPKWPRSA